MNRRWRGYRPKQVIHFVYAVLDRDLLLLLPSVVKRKGPLPYLLRAAVRPESRYHSSSYRNVYSRRLLVAGNAFQQKGQEPRTNVDAKYLLGNAIWRTIKRCFYTGSNLRWRIKIFFLESNGIKLSIGAVCINTLWYLWYKCNICSLTTKCVFIASKTGKINIK